MIGCFSRDKYFNLCAISYNVYICFSVKPARKTPSFSYGDIRAVPLICRAVVCLNGEARQGTDLSKRRDHEA
jgi:hypothetical protein